MGKESTRNGRKNKKRTRKVTTAFYFIGAFTSGAEKAQYLQFCKKNSSVNCYYFEMTSLSLLSQVWYKSSTFTVLSKIRSGISSGFGILMICHKT